MSGCQSIVPYSYYYAFLQIVGLSICSTSKMFPRFVPKALEAMLNHKFANGLKEVQWFELHMTIIWCGRDNRQFVSWHFVNKLSILFEQRTKGQLWDLYQGFHRDKQIGQFCTSGSTDRWQILYWNVPESRVFEAFQRKNSAMGLSKKF